MATRKPYQRASEGAKRTRAKRTKAAIHHPTGAVLDPTPNGITATFVLPQLATPYSLEALAEPGNQEALANFMTDLLKREDKAIVAGIEDDAAVDAFANSLKGRLATKRTQGYGGWNDPNECDARKLANLFIAKLTHGGSNITDLGAYLVFLNHYGPTGQYALGAVVKDHFEALNKLAQKSNGELATRNDLLQKELDYTRADLARTRDNLSRAMGYIDRVTDDDPPTPDVPAFREERCAIGDMSHVVIQGERRGPRLNLGFCSDADCDHRRDAFAHLKPR